MTIAASWIRKVHNCEELVFIADSRLCGGRRWDECPKLTTLPGNTCVFAFSGDTDNAYTLMLQIKQAMTSYRRIETRAMDITDINGHVLKHANHLINSIYDATETDEIPDNEFIFGGYSWVEKRFKIWRYYYNKHDGSFTQDGKEHRILHNIRGHFVAIGDKREEFKKELRILLKNKYGSDVEKQKGLALDMEPFETLCKMLHDADKCSTIGGAPQIIKSYQYMNSCPLGVYWPEKIDVFSNRTLLGRKLFNYEDTDYWFINPATLRTSPCHKINGEDDQ